MYNVVKLKTILYTIVVTVVSANMVGVTGSTIVHVREVVHVLVACNQLCMQ